MLLASALGASKLLADPAPAGTTFSFGKVRWNYGMSSPVAKLSDGSYSVIAGDGVFVSEDPLKAWHLVGRLPIRGYAMVAGGASSRLFVVVIEDSRPVDGKGVMPVTKGFVVDAKSGIKEMTYVKVVTVSFLSSKVGAMCRDGGIQITRDGGENWSPNQPVIAHGAVGAITWLNKDSLIVAGGHPSELVLLQVGDQDTLREVWRIGPDDPGIAGFSISGDGSIWSDSINGVESWKMKSGESNQVVRADIDYDHVVANGDFVFLLGAQLSIWKLPGEPKHVCTFRDVKPTAILPIKEGYMIFTETGAIKLWRPGKEVLEEVSVTVDSISTMPAK